MYSNELVCNILDFLDDNLNRKITIEEIANKFYYNRYYIMKLFKNELGVSISVYINRVRIYHSIFEIKNTKHSFTRIAIQNGFYSLEYFSEMFHKIMGISPRVYQNYCKYYFRVTIEDLEIIRKNWIELNEFVEFINQYKKNKKPVGIPVLKRSIFN